MFNSTHTLTGLILARSGLDRWAPHATLTAVIAANLPDVDILTGFPGSVNYIEHHRGITHSIVGVLGLSIALSGILYWFTRSYWKTLAVALLAMATHPALDYANTYGIQPLLPFSEDRFFGDTLNVFDLYLDGILIAGVVAGRLTKRRKLAAWAAAGAALFYIGGRVALRDAARGSLENYQASVPGAIRSAVIPEMINPREFAGIVETRNEYIKLHFRAPEGAQYREIARTPKGNMTSPIVSRALTARSAAVFRGFARFPAVEVRETAEGYRVVFLDLRYFNEQTGKGFGAEVRLDEKLEPTAESLSFTQSAE
ncbi:MAG TPA: metal-dependent hydrolase [Terriglobia bacterium]|nr:metal-dependent hydrolase [Terriglobia bacterium]